VRHVPRFHIDFFGLRKVFFAISAVLVVLSIYGLVVNGLHFGIEFQGGTVINVTVAKGVTESQLRDAFSKQGVKTESIQSTQDQGFIIRTSESNPQKANAVWVSVTKDLGLSKEAGQVTTIGPGWGKNVTNAALLAFVLSIGAILLYISVRFEYKMSITAVLALVHDLLIVLGVYALSGREVTPNTIAALLTIMGYSLYDTVVVFHRIKENSANLSKTTFHQMSNDSINQVFMRTINTSVTSLIPVLTMLFFGGQTLKDFAFALAIGLFIGTYSSFSVASQTYVLWKEQEPKFKALNKKYAATS
jgi:SecD/SecF fusion protein